VTVTTLERALATERTALPGSAASRTARAAALAELGAVGLPTTRRENWRYTDLKLLTEAELDLAPRPPDPASTRAAQHTLAAHGIANDGPRLVLVDGHVVPELGTLDPRASGVEIRDVEAYWARPGTKPRGRISAADHPLAALNAAYVQSGVWLRVADGVRLAEPLRLVLIATGAPKLAPQPRLIVELGRGAELTIVQQLVDAADSEGWLNLVTEIDQAAESRLTLLRVQEHGSRRVHTSLLAVELAAHASASLGFVDLGGRLVRNDVEVKLREPGAAVELFGLLLAAEGQHVDDHTRIDHLAPDTRSDETFRGVIGRRGRGVFNGKVVVHPGAHGIDARQSNDNLLLSDQAEIDTKPELEIYSDDVKCAHGSTVGELDAEHLFYLRSRGVDEAQAREILTVAFAATVLERIAAPNLRDRITDKVVARLRAIAEAAR
jgi:Fe-S cluster assembly protein SufD